MAKKKKSKGMKSGKQGTTAGGSCVNISKDKFEGRK